MNQPIKKPDITLTDDQLGCLAQFQKYEYVVIEGPRHSGKTTVLKQIIRESPPHWKIALVCFQSRFNQDYSDLTHPGIAHYDYAQFGIEFQKDKTTWDLDLFDLVVVDDGIIYPHDKICTACAYVPGYLRIFIGTPATNVLPPRE